MSLEKPSSSLRHSSSTCVTRQLLAIATLRAMLAVTGLSNCMSPKLAAPESCSGVGRCGHEAWHVAALAGGPGGGGVGGEAGGGTGGAGGEGGAGMAGTGDAGEGGDHGGSS